MWKGIGFCLMLAAAAAHGQDQVYKWVDEDGNIHFSDKQSAGEGSKRIELGPVNSYESVEIETAAQRPAAGNRRSRVLMYGTSWCPVCARARKYFADNGIRYTDYDIEEDERARRRYEAMDATGVPVILVGDQRLNGFSEAGFERIYEQSRNR